jgi:hypothetical protein
MKVARIYMLKGAKYKVRQIEPSAGHHIKHLMAISEVHGMVELFRESDNESNQRLFLV